MALTCCPNCAQEYSEAERACPNCGRRIRRAADPPRPREGLVHMLNVACAIVLLLGILAAVVMGVLIDQY